MHLLSALPASGMVFIWELVVLAYEFMMGHCM